MAAAAPPTHSAQKPHPTAPPSRTASVPGHNAASVQGSTQSSLDDSKKGHASEDSDDEEWLMATEPFPGDGDFAANTGSSDGDGRKRGASLQGAKSRAPAGENGGSDDEEWLMATEPSPGDGANSRAPVGDGEGE